MMPPTELRPRTSNRGPTFATWRTTDRGRRGHPDLARRSRPGLRGGLRPGRFVLDASRRGPDHGTAPPPLPDRGRTGPVRGGPEPCYGGGSPAGRRRGRHRAAGAEGRLLELAKDPAYADRVCGLLEGWVQNMSVAAAGQHLSPKESRRSRPAQRSRSAPARVSTRRRTGSGFGIWRKLALPRRSELPPIDGDGFPLADPHGWSLTVGAAGTASRTAKLR